MTDREVLYMIYGAMKGHERGLVDDDERDPLSVILEEHLFPPKVEIKLKEPSAEVAGE